jgi:glycerophosphoryl diester phosphodiesterase
MSRPFLCVAHRGARAFAPENTLPAIRLARRLGANAIELDVQMTRDGELVVFHDDDLVRCTDVTTRWPGRAAEGLSAWNWNELSQLDAGAWFVRELESPRQQRQPFLRDLDDGEQAAHVGTDAIELYASGRVRIPTVREALVAARAAGLAVILELKTIPRRYPDIGPRIVDLLQELQMEDDALVSSFDHALLADLRGRNAAISTGVITAERLYRVREYVQDLGAAAFFPACMDEVDVLRRGLDPGTLDVDLIGELQTAGVLVLPWTVNAEWRMRALLEAGVSGIITDYPNRLVRVLRERGGDLSSGPVRFATHGR